MWEIFFINRKYLYKALEMHLNCITLSHRWISSEFSTGIKFGLITKVFKMSKSNRADYNIY